MKLKFLKAHDLKDVPENVIHEIESLCLKMGIAMEECLRDVDANIVLAAFTWVHAAMIKHYISEDPEELKKATLLYARALINDVERVSDIRILEG